jgi:hypothetical protein
VKKLLIIPIFLVILLYSCKKDPFKVNVSDIEINLKITRFEKELFSADPAALENYVPRWKNEYSPFLEHFSYILRLGSIDDPEYIDRLQLFVTDYNNYEIYKRTQVIFPGLDTFSVELNNAFSYYRYYFPDKPLPRIITFISGFNQSAITDDSLLAIGLDKYLGTTEPLYKKYGIYNYLVKNMHPKKLISDCMLFWGETEFPFNDSIDNLISNMLYRGSLMYFLDAMLPDQPDSLKWGFSQKSLELCNSNEKAMWTYLIENKLLFNTDKFTINKFILEGPFTKEFGRKSPARAALWLGYKIVSEYMNKHPDISLADLMTERDYMKILNQSAYNP